MPMLNLTKCRANRMSGICLGEDLETEILVRLPAKSLMRFKCVQRSWNTLFKFPTFVTRHMHMHMQMSDHRSLMILHDDKHERYKPRITLLSCDDPTATRTFKAPFPDSCPSVVRALSHSHCNGVFCLEDLHNGDRNRLILWNPTTREVHLIPPPPSHYSNPLRYAFGFLSGFGADPNTNDFKVVNLSLCYQSREENYLSYPEIYNLSTKSWTPIHRPAPPHLTNIAFRLRPTKYKSLVNGVYHWITGYSLDRVANILCFDFGNNRFRNLKAPISHLVIDDCFRDEVAEVNSSLAYVVQYGGPVRLGIWVMDKCGWAKKYNIGPFEPMVCICGIWKDGAEVLGGKDRNLLMSYDHDGKPVRQFEIDVDNEYFRIHEYVQSIAPLST